MPIYEYRCDACGHHLEALQGFSEDPLRDCPTCGEERLRRLISAAAFRLKGGGWYETDFKKDKKRNIAGDTEKASDAKASDSKGEGKSSGEKSATDKSSDTKSSDSKSSGGKTSGSKSSGKASSGGKKTAEG